MSIPIKHLPLIQNWDCQGCGDCCRTLEAVITDEDKRRIESLDLTDDPQVGPKPWFSPAGRGSKQWKLAHRPEGGCVFLTANNRCRLEERFGAGIKPFVCRLFPYILIPAGSHWRVGMRYSCPSAAANQGRPLVEAEDDLVYFSGLLEKHVGRSGESAPPPQLRADQNISWPDLHRVVQVLVEIVQDRSDPLERRLRKCLAVARVCGYTQFDNLQGNRLSKYLQAVRSAVDTELPRAAEDLSPPDRLFGGILFRVFLAICAQRDLNVRRASGLWNRLVRVISGCRFVRGRGSVPRVNEFLPKITFDDVEQRVGRQPDLDETLERYYVVKLNSLQFCGPPNFNLPLLAGLESLILTLPMILWLRRALSDRPPKEAVQLAIQIVDNHFGGNPMLGFPHIQYLLRTMAQRGELDKLVAWYSR
ncbi:YkgJ family cysteine cluster protein [Singulisphaera rosea]